MKTTKRHCKLIRVTEGIYRTETGVAIFKRSWQDKELPWVMSWTDWMNVKQEKRFRTLADARKDLVEDK